MPFPILPKYDQGETDNLFLIQDPFGLRAAIIPLWDYDTQADIVTGLGTCFRVDPFGHVLTAFHVIEDYLMLDTKGITDGADAKALVKDEANPLGMESPGLIYGHAAPQEIVWSKFMGMKTGAGSPLDLYTSSGLKNLIEVAAIYMPYAGIQNNNHPTWLDVDYQGTVEPGEKVLAIGFPDLKVGKSTAYDETLIITERMQGSIRTVTEFIPFDGSSSRPWPRITVDGNWPRGMSGGPVFNERGHVIGVVSTGEEGFAGDAGSASARVFKQDNIGKYLTPHLDPLNPGRVLGWGILDGTALVDFKLRREDIEQHPLASQLGITRISKDLRSDGYMSF